jgi:hypothetical protein
MRSVSPVRGLTSRSFDALFGAALLVPAASRVWLALLLVAGALLATPVRADNVELIEQKIKAGLIYNFLKYTDWPAASAPGDILVCLYGGDAFDGHLQPMVGRTVHQRPIAVRVIKTNAEVEPCSLVFVHGDQKDGWPGLHKSLGNKSILTVSDFAGFTSSGGMIEFSRAESRIEVKLNVDAVSAARLTVGERLLKLASVVHTAPE